MIYVLELLNKKFYVGYSEKNDNSRINKHFQGKGAEWCKRYPPVTILGTYDGSLEQENKKTLELMALHGYNNVRGGKWVSCEDYANPPKELVNMMFNNNELKDKCSRCSRIGHVCQACPWQHDVEGDAIMSFRS